MLRPSLNTEKKRGGQPEERRRRGEERSEKERVGKGRNGDERRERDGKGRRGDLIKDGLEVFPLHVGTPPRLKNL